MVNAWSLAWEALNGTMDEEYPIVGAGNTASDFEIDGLDYETLWVTYQQTSLELFQLKWIKYYKEAISEEDFYSEFQDEDYQNDDYLDDEKIKPTWIKKRMLKKSRRTTRLRSTDLLEEILEKLKEKESVT